MLSFNELKRRVEEQWLSTVLREIETRVREDLVTRRVLSTYDHSYLPEQKRKELVDMLVKLGYKLVNAHSDEGMKLMSKHWITDVYTQQLVREAGCLLFDLQ